MYKLISDGRVVPSKYNGKKLRVNFVELLEKNQVSTMTSCLNHS